MRFAPTDDQLALRDAVRELLAERCPPAAVRAAWPGGSSSAVEDLWRGLVDMGVPGMLVPETGGGLGLDETDLVPMLIETGYAAVPLPVVETVAVAAPLLAEAGDDRLAGVLSGRIRVALAGPDGYVPFAGRADLVLTLTATEARLAPFTIAEPVPTVDGSRAMARVDLAAAAALRGDPALAADRATLGTAAQLIGLTRRMLDLTVSYVGTRRQFGVPVGSFQAVKHQLAEALLGLEFAAPAVLAAAWAVARDTGSRSRDVSAAAVLAAEAAQAIARTAIQCHGAIGYTVEYDLHLYAKRAWALAAGCATDAHLARIADALNLKGAAR